MADLNKEAINYGTDDRKLLFLSYSLSLLKSHQYLRNKLILYGRRRLY